MTIQTPGEIAVEAYTKGITDGTWRGVLQATEKLADALGSCPPNDAKRPGLEWAVKELKRLCKLVRDVP